MTTESYNPMKRQQDLQTLTNIIVSWNSTRLDLFELTLPNEDLEFSGKYYKKYKIGKGRKLIFFICRCDEVLLPASTVSLGSESLHKVC